MKDHTSKSEASRVALAVVSAIIRILHGIIKFESNVVNFEANDKNATMDMNTAGYNTVNESF